MRYLLLLIFVISGSAISAQDSLNHQLDFGIWKHHDIYMSINRSPKVDSLDAGYYSVEMGFAWSYVVQSIHPTSVSWYVGQELGLRKGRLIHGSKVGAWSNYNMLSFGFELAHQTDYEHHAFNFWPSMGLGMYPLNISIAARVRLSGKAFQPLNKVRINIFIPLIQLKKELKTSPRDTGGGS